MLTWQAAGGLSVNAAVSVEGRDRAGRERLLRYGAPAVHARAAELGKSATEIGLPAASSW